MGKLAGQSALVTGGGSGIGLAVARQMLAEGARVAITGRSADKLRRAAEELNAGDRLVWHPADLAEPGQATAMVEQVLARLGRIDLLVNNAGMNVKERGFRELTPERWHELMGANLHAAFHCLHAVVPHMRRQGGGLVVNINSISGKRAHPLGGLAYVAAKFGLRGLSLGLAAEEKESHIRVSSVYPGEVNTPILDARPRAVTAEQRARMLQPDDVAGAVLFLATLPAHVWVPELVITPADAQYL